MNDTPPMASEQLLKNIICEEVYVQNNREQIDVEESPNAWLFDFRRISMRGDRLNLITEVFYERLKGHYPFQIGTMEVAGVPIVAALALKFYERGFTDINTFFIRKSRKKSGLMRLVEGRIEDNKKIILLDDIINTGNSFWHQITVLEHLGYTIDSIWSILRYRDMEYYERFAEKGIAINSLFTLDELTPTLGTHVHNLRANTTGGPRMLFRAEWVFRSANPTYKYVASKSQPLLDESNVYFGSDNRTFWAISQNDGSVVWKFNTGFPAKKKSIFSNPALHNDTIVFGSYDGNVYALNKKTGERIWTYSEADWVGSSPAIAHDLGYVFVGLEFGLIRKYGGIVALDIATGKKKWWDNAHKGLTHSSPLYIQKHTQVVIGSNDGVVRMYEAKNGRLVWTFVTVGGQTYHPERDRGFGAGDIKESFAYDEKRDYVIFGSLDGNLYILKRATGVLVKTFACQEAVWATPYVHDDHVYYTSLDKRVRCVSLRTLEILFEQDLDGTRIFSSPIVLQNKLYVGTNAGRLHQLNMHTGKSLGYFQAAERITNTVCLNEHTHRFFLPTFANEIYCLSEKGDA